MSVCDGFSESSKSSISSSLFFGLIIKEPNKIELNPTKLNAAVKIIQYLHQCCCLIIVYVFDF